MILSTLIREPPITQGLLKYQRLTVDRSMPTAPVWASQKEVQARPKAEAGGTGVDARKGDSRDDSKGAQAEVWWHFPMAWMASIRHPESMCDFCRLGGTSAL